MKSMGPGSAVFLFILLAMARPTLAGETAEAAPRPVFSFGADNPGGQGGAIVRVTTLVDHGPGSLREALAYRGPRIIVFEVGGVIDLREKTLVVNEPFVTLAGETAPSPGITLIGAGVYIQTHDVIVRHLWVRPGDAGRPKGSGWEPDGISVVGKDAHNVLIEHCSISWAVDENVSVSGPAWEGPENTARRVTLRNCIVAEALNRSSHAKGPHSKGMLVHNHCSNVAVIANLFAHKVDRNPYFKQATTGVVINNVFYNPGTRAIYVNYPVEDRVVSGGKLRHGRVSVVGNLFLHGADTKRGLPLVSGDGQVYMQDNILRAGPGKSPEMTDPKIDLLATPPTWPDRLVADPADDQLLERLLATAGARPADRDAVDRRIIDDTRNGRGRIIDSQADVGGYPPVAVPTRRELRPPGKEVEAWLAEFAAEVE